MRICADTQCELVFADSRYIRSQDAIDATRAAGIRVIDVFSDWENGEKICLPRVKSVPPRGELRYDIALDDVIVMAHTSGSTGRNKCVRKSMKSYFGKKGYCAAFRHAILAADYIAHLSVINVSPWYHNTGMYMLLLCVCGAAVTEVTITKYSPVLFAKVLNEFKCLICIATPTMVYRACKTCGEGERLRLPNIAMLSGEAMGEQVFRTIEIQKNIQVIYYAYGTTETGIIAVALYKLKRLPLWLSAAAGLLQRAGWIGEIYAREMGIEDLTSLLGEICRNAEVVIWNEEADGVCADGVSGEICVKTTTQMKAYGDGRKNSAYCWIHGERYIRTGDVGYKKGKLLYLAGRKKRLIIRSGVNIVPGDIEKYVEGYEGVNAVVVCAVPNTAYGEDICVCIESAYEEVDLESVKEKLDKELPKYMRPQYYMKWREFPVNASGKIDIRQIEKQAREMVRKKN